jgi:alpha-1,6-mannosyltransferase
MMASPEERRFPAGMTTKKASNLREGRPWMTNAALCLLGLGLMLLTKEYGWEYGSFGHYVLGGSECSGWSVWLYVAAVVVVMTQPMNRATLWIVGAVALGMHAMLLFAEPFSSSDIYRYVWDGIAQHAGVNPYRYVPGDAALTYLRAPHQDVFDNINRRDYAHTIYPPVAQVVYWLVTWFSPTVTAMKAAMVGFECLTAGALMAMLRMLGRPREQVLLFAWCPLLTWEIGGGGHVDAVCFALIAVAMLFRFRDQPWMTGLFLGLAVFTKFYPLVLFPALWKRGDWKMPAAIAAVGAVGYAMYSSVGMGVFGFLGGYSKEEGIDSGARFFLLDLVQQRVHDLEHLPAGIYFVFCALVMGGISGWCWRYATVESGEAHISESRYGAPASLPEQGKTQLSFGNDKQERQTPAFVRGAMMLALAMMLLFSPHYPWYIAWLVPFVCLIPELPLMAYVLGFFYLFTTELADPGPKMFLLNEILYGGLLGMVLLQVLVLRRWPLRRVFGLTAVSFRGAWDSKEQWGTEQRE